MGSRNTNRSYVYLWVALSCLSIAGCSTLKNSLMTGAATSAVVGVTSVLPGGVIVPTIAGGVTAATASALTAEGKGNPVEVTAETVVQQAPDNFFTLLGKLVGMGGKTTLTPTQGMLVKNMRSWWKITGKEGKW